MKEAGHSLQETCWVQTWPEGERYDLPSYCGMPDAPFASMTVTDVAIKDAVLNWTTRLGWFKDHSKWAVSPPEEKAVSKMKQLPLSKIVCE